jgi:sigma-B regulation protein RsbU (phosphoserine phosphatase)
LKKLILILLLFSFLTLAGQVDNSPKVRIIVLSKIGQKERVKISDKVSVVLGPNIKPEYSYLNYSSGNNSEEYYVELKSNELFLKEISSLRHSLDSLKEFVVESLEYNKYSKEPQVSANTAKNSDTAKIIPFTAKAIHDTIFQKKNASEDNGIFSKIPSIQSSIEALNFIKNANKETLDNNNAEYIRNKLRIDTLLKEIDLSIKTGKNKHLLKEFYKELDSLKARNIGIEAINSALISNNSILESELHANKAEADFLKLMLYSIIAIVLFLIAFALIIYFNYRQKKKFNIELEKINSDLTILNNNLNISNEQKAKLLKVINKELEFAAVYVKSLLPVPIKNNNLKTDWIFIPSEELGGDAFGYNKIDEDNYAFYLLDVSGHGVGPALHSVQVLNILQNLALPNVDFKNPNEVLNALNKIFQMNNYRGLYFTICYAVYNQKSRKLRYSAAGHPPMLLVNKKEVKALEAQHIFIGAVENIDYKSDEIEIKKDSSLYLFSDGVFELERANKTMYTFNEFQSDFIDKIEVKKESFKQFYEHSKTITGKDDLDDDFSILKVTFS